MSKYDGVTIEIINWEKYNPRADVKASSWYRKAHSIHFDPEWAHLSAEEMNVWDFLLATASMKNKSQLLCSVVAFARGARVSEKELTSALEKLETLQCVAAHVTDTSRTRNVHDTHTCLRTDGRTDDIGGSSEPAQPAFDFEFLFKEYPRRKGDQGKKRALARCVREFSTPAKYDALLLAVRNYRRYCDRERSTGTEFVKQFVTFVNGAWEEWVSPQGILPEPKKLKTMDDLLKQEAEYGYSHN